MSNAINSSHAMMALSTHGRVSNHSTTLIGGTDHAWSLVTQLLALRAWQARTLSSRHSSNSTATIVSRCVKVSTSTWCSHTNTTPTSLPLVSTCTALHSPLNNTNLQARATCRVLITPRSSSRSPTTRLALQLAQWFEFMQLIIMCCALCQEWEGLRTVTNEFAMKLMNLLSGFQNKKEPTWLIFIRYV